MKLLTKGRTTGLAVAGLALVLAGCGDSETPEVVEPNPQGADTGDETADTEGEDTGDTGTEGEDTGDETGGDDTGQTGAEGDTGEETEGDDGGDVAAGSEVDKTAFLDRLKAPGNDVLGSFQFDMNMDAQGQSIVMSGQADMRGDSPAMEANMEIPGAGAMHMIMVDGSMYMSMPELTGEGKYMEMTPEDLAMGGEDPMAAIDMESTWDAWDEGATSVTLVGTEEIEGESMERYTLNVDTATALEASGQDSVAGMPDTIAYDVWIDENDLMRKVAFDIMGAQTEMTINNWGEDVDVQAPDPSSIVDMPGM